MATQPKPALALLAVAIFLSLAVPASAQAVTPVPTLDQTRIAGTWYEIARLPTKRERACVSDAFQIIARGDKLYQLYLVDSCKTQKGFTNITNLNAKSADKKSGGLYKITTFWPFSRKYWFLAVSPDYDWCIVGDPNHKELWLYATTRTVTPDRLTQLESLASAQGFPSSRLVLTPQTQH